MLDLSKIQNELMREIADLSEVPQGAYNFRANGQLAGRHTTANIDINSKENGSGIDIFIKPNTSGETVHIPVVISESGVKWRWKWCRSRALIPQKEQPLPS